MSATVLKFSWVTCVSWWPKTPKTRVHVINVSRMCTRFPVRTKKQLVPTSKFMPLTSRTRPTPKIGHGSGYVSLLLGPWTLVLHGGLLCTVSRRPRIVLAKCLLELNQLTILSGPWHFKHFSPEPALSSWYVSLLDHILGENRAKTPLFQEGLATEGATRS